MKFNYKTFKDLKEKYKELGFDSKIYEAFGYEFEIFTYLYTEMSSFYIHPILKEFRGITFCGKKGEDKKLFSLGFQKFFNYGETFEGISESPVEMVEKYGIKNIYDKADGSLITVGVIGDKVLVKSKSSFISEQAKKAQNIVDNNIELQKIIKELVSNNLYPIFEYISPENKIVVNYNETKLILLSIRNAITGEYLNFEEIKEIYYNNFSKTNDVDLIKEYNNLTLDDIFKKVKSDFGYEGFILELNNEERVKIKLEDYLEKHYLKAFISSDKKIIELALNEDLDDIKILFKNDKVGLNKINEIENLVFSTINQLKNEVERIYENDKDLDVKSFALKHKDKDIFSLLMKQYKSGNPDYKKYTYSSLTKKGL